MSNLKIYPYNIGSESAKDLAIILNAIRIKPDGNYIPKQLHTIINWGSSRIPNWASRATGRGVKILNSIDKVSIAGNKLQTLRTLQSAGVSVPEFTTDMNVARRWVNTGGTVVERHNLRGNSGEGIRIVNLDDENMPSVIQNAPLYTKFIPKTAEFRVHVFNGQVIDYIEKKKMAVDRRPVNFNKYVSSVHQGWVFARTDVRDIPEVKQIAIKAVRALGLDFGAVDVIYYEGCPYVLEVNTAPGLSGTTLVRYANALRRYMGVADLPMSQVNEILGSANEIVPASPAANIAQDRLGSVSEDGMVTLRLDRATALKLKSLLAYI